MSATSHTEVLDGPELYDELHGQVSDRTREILERRRRTAIVRTRGWLVRRVLLAADLIGLVSALLLAESIITPATHAGALSARDETLVFLASLPAWVVIAKLYGLYDRDEERTDHSTVDDFGGVFHMVTVCTWSFWVIAQLTHIAHPTTPKLVIFWAAAIGFISVGRAAARTLARKSVAYVQNTVIVGAGDVGQLMAQKMLQHPEYGLYVVGFVDSDPVERREELEHLAHLGGPERLPALIGLLDIERVVIAFSQQSHGETLELIRSIRKLDVQIDIVPRLFETFGPNVGVHLVEGLPLVGLPPLRLSRSSALLKRTADIALSLGALLLVAPFLLVVALAVKLDSRGPALYRHERVGRNGRHIEVLKFRTMHRDACRGRRYGGEGAEARFAELMADADRAREFLETQKLTEDPRATRVGRLLRRTSLDELPQLINVVVGDLSLVGPRAITGGELARYGDRVDDLLGVRPGITGYWQVNGRSDLSYHDRVRLDLSYIHNWSLKLDLNILARTLKVLVSRHGAV